MLWNEPQNHNVDCYFFNTTLIKGFDAMNKQQIVYADVPFVAKPVLIHVQDYWYSIYPDIPSELAER